MPPSPKSELVDMEGRSGMPIISQKSGIQALALALGGDGMF